MAQRLDISTAQYLADPAPKPSLSSSIAKLIVERSPLHAKLAHPRFGGAQHESSAAAELGTLVHRLVLGKGAEIVEVDAKDWRTQAARDHRDLVKSLGRIPVLKGALQAARAAADAILAELAAANVYLAGESETAILWQENADYGPIWCRAMLDHVIERDGALWVYDLKTIYSAHPQDCMRSSINFSYDIQQEAYICAAEMLWPEYAGRVHFVFLFAETEPPYGVTIGQLDSLMQQRGRRRWAEAVQTWSQCLATNRWPGYSRQPVTLWSPTWLLYRESEAAEARGEALEL